MDKIFLNEALGEVSIATDIAKNQKYVLLLAHGAGAGFDHKFMSTLAGSMAQHHGTVVRYNFPYIEAGKKFPGSPKANIQATGLVVKHFEKQFPDIPMFLSGKSYGGRMSSHWVHQNPDNPVRGLIYFGFPLHAPGKAGKDRAEHLPEIHIPQLFIQGTRDALANYSLIQEVVEACPKADLSTISEADHSFKVPKKISNKAHSEIIADLGKITDDWILKHLL